MTEFGVELREWRTRNNLVQNHAAALLDVKLRTYQNWEQGYCEPAPLAKETIRRRMKSNGKVSGGVKGKDA